MVICISVHRVCSYGVLTPNFRMEHCHRFHLIDMAADYEPVIVVNIKLFNITFLLNVIY